MKKTYIQPASTMIVLSDALCNIVTASVVNGDDGSHVDHIDVVEGDKSESSMDWGVNSWGGD